MMFFEGDEIEANLSDLKIRLPVTAPIPKDLIDKVLEKVNSQSRDITASELVFIKEIFSHDDLSVYEESKRQQLKNVLCKTKVSIDYVDNSELTKKRDIDLTKRLKDYYRKFSFYETVAGRRSVTHLYTSLLMSIEEEQKEEKVDEVISSINVDNTKKMNISRSTITEKIIDINEDFFKNINATIKNKIVITGEPGTGKSLLCQRIAYQWSLSEDIPARNDIIKPLWQKFNLLIWIKIRELSDRKVNYSHFTLEGFLSDYFTDKGLEIPTYTFSSWFENSDYNICWIIDGLDEMTRSNQKEGISKILNKIINRNRNNEIVLLTSRPQYYDYNYISDDFIRIKILGFPEKGISSYINNYFHHKSDEIESKRETLVSMMEQQITVNQLMRIPMMSYFICVLWSEYDKNLKKNIQVSRYDLFSEIVDYIWKNYLIRRGFANSNDINSYERDDIKAHPEIGKIYKVLTLLSWNAFVKGKHRIKGGAILKIIKEFQGSLNPSDRKNTIDEIIETGFIRIVSNENKDINNIYEFCHPSIQEYFSAMYWFENRFKDNACLDKDIFKRMDSKYFYIWWFIASRCFDNYKIEKEICNSNFTKYSKWLLTEPFELVGLHHFQLVMMLLNECVGINLYNEPSNIKNQLIYYLIKCLNKVLNDGVLSKSYRHFASMLNSYCNVGLLVAMIIGEWIEKKMIGDISINSNSTKAALELLLIVVKIFPNYNGKYNDLQNVMINNKYTGIEVRFIGEHAISNKFNDVYRAVMDKFILFDDYREVERNFLNFKHITRYKYCYWHCDISELDVGSMVDFFSGFQFEYPRDSLVSYVVEDKGKSLTLRKHALRFIKILFGNYSLVDIFNYVFEHYSHDNSLCNVLVEFIKNRKIILFRLNNELIIINNDNNKRYTRIPLDTYPKKLLVTGVIDLLKVSMDFPYFSYVVLDKDIFNKYSLPNNKWAGDLSTIKKLQSAIDRLLDLPFSGYENMGSNFEIDVVHSDRKFDMRKNEFQIFCYLEKISNTQNKICKAIEVNLQERNWGFIQSLVKSISEEGFVVRSVGDRAFTDLCKLAFSKGDVKFLEVLDDLYNNGYINGFKWILPENGLQLSSGDIIKLAGDYFGLPEQPICEGKNESDRRNRFLRAYESLCVEQDSVSEVNKILNLFKKEQDNLGIGFRQGLSPILIMRKNKSSMTMDFAKVTQNSWFPGSFYFSRYINLAAMNFDSFADEAKLTYYTGHAVALLTAHHAAIENDENLKMKLLIKAITQELFACHYLVNLFACGHIRTPRKAMFKYVQNKIGWFFLKREVAGILAREMHDEDSKNGFLVCNRFGEHWRILGDDCTPEETNTQNQDQIIKTLNAALMSIFDTYLGRNVTYNFKLYRPRLQSDNDNNPLFKVDKNGEVVVRQDLSNSKSDQYVRNWSPMRTLIRLTTKQFFVKKADSKICIGDEVSIEKDLSLEINDDFYNSSKARRICCDCNIL